MMCPKCVVIWNAPTQPGVSYSSITFKPGYCDLCRGKRNLNWIEEIFGVNEDYKPDHVYYANIKGNGVEE